MNSFRLMRGIGIPHNPLRQFSGGAKKATYTVGLGILSLARKAPLTACFLGGVGFSHYKYQELKKEVSDKLNPMSKMLEKLGIKEPKAEEQDVSGLASSCARAILACDPTLDTTPHETDVPKLKEIKSCVLEMLDRLEQKIAPPVKENTLIDSSSKVKGVLSALSSLGKAGESRILYELECKKEELKKEIRDRDK
jgi:hypothetical protein